MEICEVCHVNTATIHLTQIENGSATTRHLCQDCAESEGLQVIPNDGSEEAIEDLDDFNEMQSCPKCNTSEDEIVATGEVGCSACYETFNDLLSSIAGYKYNYQRYNGKMYHQSSSREFHSELDILRRELDTAIREERFEVARVLRDRIRDLEIQEDSRWS